MAGTGSSSDTLPADLANGRFRCIAMLGRGSQGLTFVAEDRERGGRVAIKRFQIQGAPSWKQVELAEREAEVLATLKHPNLPAYVAHFEEGGALYLVMELVEGKTLAELKRAGALGQSDVVELLKSAAKTLDYLHGRAPPIVHRDVKPQNVIRRPDGSFVLVDFGSVRDKLRPEGGSTVVGTFGYMAPEQFQGRALPVTDTYGLGATAMACLSGEEPENLPHRGLAIDVRRALAGRADPRVIELLEQMLEPDPERRPQDLLGAVAALSKPSARPSAKAEPSRKSVGWGELAEALTQEAVQTANAEARIAVERALSKLHRRRDRRERKRLHRAERERRREVRRAARRDGSHRGGGLPFRSIAIAVFITLGILSAALERPLFPLWLLAGVALFLVAKRRQALREAAGQVLHEPETRVRLQEDPELDEQRIVADLEDELSGSDRAEHEPRARR